MSDTIDLNETPGPANSPTISSVNSNVPVTVSSARQWVTVQGSNFQSGYSATFWDPSNVSYQIDAARLQWVTSTSLNVYVGLTLPGTWKVRVTNPDGGVSNRFEFDVEQQNSVAMPQFSPPPGTYSPSVSVSMSCTTPNALVRYTTNGDEPISTSPHYNGTPVLISSWTTLKARGFLTGSTPSATKTGTYVISSTPGISPPTLSPDPSQTYTGSVRVYMYASPSTATIRYTVEGGDPTQTSGWVYNGSPVIINATTTFKVKAFYAGSVSPTTTVTYTVAQNGVSTPYFSPPPGNYAQGQMVSIYCDTPGALIRYNLGSSDPTETYGFDYSGPIGIGPGSTVTIRAKAFRTGWPASGVGVGTWTIAPPPPSSLQCDPLSISVMVSKQNPQTTVIVNEQNTSDQSIQVGAGTSAVPWASWNDFQMQIPAHGTLQNQVFFSGDSLAPGTYHATMLVQQSGYAPQQIPVTLTVQDYPAVMECSTHSLTPTCVERDNAQPDTFTIQNVGGGTLSYSLTQNVPWVSLTPASGLSAGDTNMIQVNYATTALTAAAYEGSITITGNGVPPQTVLVHLTVTPYGPNVPVITNITPQKGSVLGGARVIISGKNLGQTSAVTFGGTAATKLEDVYDTSLVATTPPYDLFGKVDVEVVAAGGTTTRKNGFEYLVVRSDVIEEVAQIGGGAWAVAAQGNYVYTNEGSSFVVVDVTTSSSPTKIARLRLAGMVTSIALLENLAYVTIGDMGLAILDVADPTNPVLRAYQAIDGWAQSVEVFGGYAYVAVEKTNDNNDNKVMIFDILEPDKPEFISSISLWDSPLQLAVAMQGASLFAYVAFYGIGFQIVDITDPTNPQLRGTYNVADGYRLAVKANYVYLCSTRAPLMVVNVADPDNPVLSKSVPGVIGLGVFVGENNMVYTYSTGELRVLDASDPANPVLNGWCSTQGGGYYLCSVGSTVYLAGSGLAVCDASNPNSPSQVGSLPGKLPYTQFLDLSNGYAYCSEFNGGFRVVDVHNPFLPVLRGQVENVTGHVGPLCALNNRVYGSVLSGANRLCAFAVDDPDAPSFLTAFDNSVLIGYLAVSGGLLYVAAEAGSGSSCTYGLYAYNLTNPDSPSRYSSIDWNIDCADGGRLAGGAVSGSIACLAVSDGGMQVIDVSNPAVPVMRGLLPLTEGARDVALQGTTAVITNASNGILIADVGDMDSPSLLATYTGVQSAQFVAIDGSRVYISGSIGVEVVDISTVSSPVPLGFYSLPRGWAWDIAVRDGYIYVCDESNGLEILRFKDSTDPSVVILNPTPGSEYSTSASNVSLAGGANDNEGVVGVYWSSDRGDGGIVSGTSSWTVPDIPLQPGMNVLTVTTYDAAGNTNSATLNVSYTPPDTTRPTVISALRVDTNPSRADIVSYSVTFSEPVTGVDAAHFTVSTSGSLTGVSVAEITGEGPTRLVTVNTGTGDGTLWLGMDSKDASIADLAGNPLNGSFDSADGYTIDRTPPTVLSCRVDPQTNPTNAGQVAYTVQFSEGVLGVAMENFVPAGDGVSNASVIGVEGGGDTYRVTVATGTGDGLLALNVAAVSETVVDSAGNVFITGLEAGESYLVDKSAPVITVQGDALLNVEAGTSYTDMGATATDAVDGPLTSTIVTAGLPINTGALGTHAVTYMVQDTAGNAAQAVRTVNVVDTTKPIITLNGNPTVTVEAKTTYADLGATATDAYEGDLTARIATVNPVNTAMIGDYTVTYDVADSSGNAALEAVRTVRVRDTQKPIITLTGEASVSVDIRTAYSDAGATALDNYDGDLTPSIVTGNHVDTSKAGDYTVTYDVSDSSENAATQVVRAVHVIQTTGMVQVTVTPATAHWSFTDGNGGAHSSVGSETIPDVPTGQIILTWIDLADYDRPTNPPQQTLAKAQTVTFSAAYTRQLGAVRVEVTPTTAPWSFTDGDGEAHAGTGPQTVANVATGQIALSWNALANYNAPTTPAPQTLSQGGTVTFTDTYISFCDLDGDGSVNALDVQNVINAALGLGVAFDCDVNGDEEVDALDVQLVINAALGLW